jgi:hypothetical protein
MASQSSNLAGFRKIVRVSQLSCSVYQAFCALRSLALCVRAFAAALEAFAAIALRSLAVKALALAFPPSRPNATAAEFFVSLMTQI